MCTCVRLPVPMHNLHLAARPAFPTHSLPWPQVSAEDAARRAHASTLRHGARGGLGEEGQGGADALGAGGLPPPLLGEEAQGGADALGAGGLLPLLLGCRHC